MIMEHKGGRKVKLKVMWSDMTTTWEALNSLFLHKPILVTKYAIKHQTLLKPGWHVVKKYLEINSTTRDHTRVYKLTSKRAKVYKFGIQVPQDSLEVLEIDYKRGETYWTDSINTEIGCLNQYTTFRVLKLGELIPPEYKQIPYIFVFNVKVDLR